MSVRASETIELTFTPETGYTAQQVVDLVQSRQAYLSDLTILLPYDPPAEGERVIAKITGAAEPLIARTVTLVNSR
jgi:hypothetical protein